MYIHDRDIKYLIIDITSLISMYLMQTLGDGAKGFLGRLPLS